MKQSSKLSNAETNDDILITNSLFIDDVDIDDHQDLLHHTNITIATSATTMMADSLDATGTKMLMPHEMVGPSATAGNGSLVGQHSIHSSYSGDHMHHTSQFYHHSSSTGFNGFHNSYHSYSTLSNGTMIHNGHTTFSNLIHQQAPMNNNHHHSAVTLPSNVTPLIHQQTFYGSDKSHHQQSNQTAVDQTNKINDVKEEEIPAANETPEVALTVEDATPEEPEPEIDIVISNVVCAFSVRCRLALKEIALNGANVEFKRENGMVTMKLRKPYTTASIWSSGKITCTGATSEDQVKLLCFMYSYKIAMKKFFCRQESLHVAMHVFSRS